MEDEQSNDQFEIDMPVYIELNQSKHAYNDLGVFSRMKLNSDQFLGSFKGKIKKSMSQCADPNYVWTILSSRQIPLFYIDASDPKDSNWLRFIRSTNDLNKYNVICMQQNQKINYFTYREIKEGEELLTYLPGKKKKAKNKGHHNLAYKLVSDEPEQQQEEVEAEPEPELEQEQDQDELVKNDSPNNQEEEKEDQEEEQTKSIKTTKKEDLIDLKLLCQDQTKLEDYFFNFDFTLKINNLKKLKRKLIKCDLCPYSAIIDSSNGNDSLVKNHIINEHLEFKNSSNLEPNLDSILSNLIDSVIKKIENTDYSENTFESIFEFKCNQDSEMFNSKQDLYKHIFKSHSDMFLNKLKCIYCNKQFSDKNLKDFISHLNLVHKEDILNNQLLSGQVKIEHDLNSVNWNDYFSLDQSKSTKQIHKTWTCQMCKKQFDQRIDLSKHQCIELNLRLLKKKKELRKKKWREAHWKRKIDLSYIETTCLTQMSNNIADNLSFCIDGTQEDLKSYSREVKDYLTTELNNETQIQMLLKLCLPDLYQNILNELRNLTESNAGQLVDTELIKRANQYFMNTDLNCKLCKNMAFKANDLFQHIKEKHDKNFDLKTAYELSEQKSFNLINSPIGYLMCDPISYMLNLIWDKEIKIKCVNCEIELFRGEYKQHLAECNSKTEPEPAQVKETEEQEQEQEIIIFSAKTDSPPPPPPAIQDFKLDEENLKIVQEILDDLIQNVENQKLVNDSNKPSVTTTITTRRRKRTAQESIEEHLGSNNILSSKKRSIQNQVETQTQTQTQIQTRKSTRSSTNTTNKLESPITRTSPRNKTKVSDSPPQLKDKNPSPKQQLKQSKKSEQDQTKLISVKVINNRKIHMCEKCGLEFTSGNSVLRHQEKSCLRIKVININNSSKSQPKKKCPICSSVFFNTHRLSIHIFRHHRNLLGSANEPVLEEAKHLSELQLQKIKNGQVDLHEDENDEEADYDEDYYNTSVDDLESGENTKKALLNTTV